MRNLKDYNISRIDYDEIFSELVYYLEQVINELNFYDEDVLKQQIYFTLKKNNIFFQQPENSISSEEYWLHYFENNPDNKPAHIVFYNGSPYFGVRTFLRKYGIKPSKVLAKDPNLGFEENSISELGEFSTDANSDSRMWQGYREIIDTANEIIDEYYNQN